jgi:hypothetical protein
MASEEQIMTAIYDMDPGTSTIATAWSSSDLGDPETGPTDMWEALEADVEADRKPRSITRHAGFVAALVGVFGMGAAFGLAVFDFADWTPPTITLPYVSTQETPDPIEVASSVSVSAPDTLPKPVAAAPPTVVSPTPTAPESAPVAVAPTVANQPGPVTQPQPVTIFSPPANTPDGGKVTVDIAIPPPPDAVPVPDEPDPEPENPKPKPTLQLAPGTDSTTLQPVQPPTLKKPRTALNNPYSPGSKPKANRSPKPSQRTALSKP